MLAWFIITEAAISDLFSQTQNHPHIKTNRGLT